MKEEKLLTVKEYAKKEGVSEIAIYKRIERKALIPVKKYGRILLKP